jgi:hypothetical protein
MAFGQYRQGDGGPESGEKKFAKIERVPAGHAASPREKQILIEFARVVWRSNVQIKDAAKVLLSTLKSLHLPR